MQSDSMIARDVQVIDHAVVRAALTVLRDHPDGTNYRVVVRHPDAAARDRHEELGFFDGWGMVTGQLAQLVEKT